MQKLMKSLSRLKLLQRISNLQMEQVPMTKWRALKVYLLMPVPYSSLMRTSKLIQKLSLPLTIWSTNSQRTTQMTRYQRKSLFLLKSRKINKKRRRSSSTEKTLPIRQLITTLSSMLNKQQEMMPRKLQLKLPAWSSQKKRLSHMPTQRRSSTMTALLISPKPQAQTTSKPKASNKLLLMRLLNKSLPWTSITWVLKSLNSTLRAFQPTIIV